MPEPLSNQSGAEQELPQYIECLLSVSGDAAFLNTFDKERMRPTVGRPPPKHQAQVFVPRAVSGAGGDPAPRLSQGRTPVVRGLLGSRRRPV